MSRHHHRAASHRPVTQTRGWTQSRRTGVTHLLLNLLLPGPVDGEVLLLLPLLLDDLVVGEVPGLSPGDGLAGEHSLHSFSGTRNRAVRELGRELNIIDN